MNGRLDEGTDKVLGSLPVGGTTLVDGRMAKGTDRAPIPVPKVTNTSVDGRVDGNTDKAPLPLPMEQSRKAYLKTVNSSMPRRHQNLQVRIRKKMKD